LTEMDFLTVSVKMAQTFEATTIRGKRGTFITIGAQTTRRFLAIHKKWKGRKCLQLQNVLADKK
jgi:hypothetical protein